MRRRPRRIFFQLLAGHQTFTVRSSRRNTRASIWPQVDTRTKNRLHDPAALLRIAVVTETYPPEVNGVAMTLGRICEGLRERGVPLQVIRPRQAQDSAASAPKDDALVLMPGMRVPGYAAVRIGLPFAGSRIESAWRRWRPDIVHIATEGPLGWSALRAAHRSRIPVTSSFHTNFHGYASHYCAAPLQNAVMRYLRNFHNRTGVTIVPTTEKLEELHRIGFQRLAVVGRGADISRFSPQHRSSALRTQLGVRECAPLVLHVGRLAAEKNLDLLFAGFSAIRAVRPEARLVIVGDGPERTRLERRHSGHVFTGIRTGEELARLYASADLFLYPSLTETYGNVTVEAMASGLAVLAFDYAAAREHIAPGVNGYLARYGDAVDFIARAREMALSAGGLQGLRARARTTAEGLGWDPVVQNFLSTLVRTREAWPHAGTPDACLRAGAAAVEL